MSTQYAMYPPALSSNLIQPKTETTLIMKPVNSPQTPVFINPAAFPATSSPTSVSQSIYIEVRPNPPQAKMGKGFGGNYKIVTGRQMVHLGKSYNCQST